MSHREWHVGIMPGRSAIGEFGCGPRRRLRSSGRASSGAALPTILSQLGETDIVVVDAGPLFATGGSTSHAPGLVFQTNPSKLMVNLAQETVRAYQSFELDGQPCWHAVGSLEVAATPRRMEDLKRRLGFARSYGLEASLLTPEEAADKIPLLDPSQILGAYWVPSDGLAKAVRVCEAMARAAQAVGVEFHGRTPVTGIEVADGRVQAVVTANGRIATERVLICAGIWGPKVGRMAGNRDPADAGRASDDLDQPAGGAGGRVARDRPPDPAPSGPRTCISGSGSMATALGRISTSRDWSMRTRSARTANRMMSRPPIRSSRRISLRPGRTAAG